MVLYYCHDISHDEGEECHTKQHHYHSNYSFDLTYWEQVAVTHSRERGKGKVQTRYDLVGCFLFRFRERAQIVVLVPSFTRSYFSASPVSLTNGNVVPKTSQKVCGVEGDEQQSEHFIVEERLVLLEKSALVSILFLK